MLKVWIVVAALAATGLVQAQGTGGKKELVAKVLQLQQPGLEQMARTMAQQPAAMMMQQAAPVIQRLPAERRDALARDIEADVRKYVEEMCIRDSPWAACAAGIPRPRWRTKRTWDCD